MGSMQQYAEERLAKRAQVKVTIGDYTLTLDPKWQLFNVTHNEGRPVPKGLAGQWKLPWQFRAAAEKLHGSAYSVNELAKQKQDYADAARNVGIDPTTIRIDGPNGGRK